MRNTPNTCLTVAIVGEALIDFIRQSDEDYYCPILGGAPYNFAVAMARQGMETHFLSPISDDPFGKKIREALTKDKIKAPLNSGQLTSLAIVNMDDEKQATYSFYREKVADRDFTIDQFFKVFPEEANIFHTGGLALSTEDKTKYEAIFIMLKQRNIKISLDLNIRYQPQMNLAGYLVTAKSLARYADILKMSIEDVNELYGQDMDLREITKQLMQDGTQAVVITRGKQGSSLFTNQHNVEFSGYPTTNITDTIGASDTFLAALIANMGKQNILQDLTQANHAQLLDALKYASAAALLTTQKLGSQPPTAKEVENYLTSVATNTEK